MQYKIISKIIGEKGKGFFFFIKKAIGGMRVVHQKNVSILKKDMRLVIRAGTSKEEKQLKPTFCRTKSISNTSSAIFFCFFGGE